MNLEKGKLYGFSGRRYWYSDTSVVWVDDKTTILLFVKQEVNDRSPSFVCVYFLFPDGVLRYTSLLVINEHKYDEFKRIGRT